MKGFDDQSNRDYYKTDPYEKRSNKYNVHPVLVDSSMVTRIPAERDGKTESQTHTPSSFWKWGESILKPGIDIKNKIIVLLEDTLNYLKRTQGKTEEDEIKLFVDKLTRDLFRTVEESPIKQKDKEVFGPRNVSKRHRRKSYKPVDVAFVSPTKDKWRDSEVSLKYDFWKLTRLRKLVVRE